MTGLCAGPVALAWLLFVASCAVNPVPTPASSSGGFTFSPGQLDSTTGADATSDTRGGTELLTGVQDPEAGDATGAGTDAAADTATVPDAEPADTTPMPDTALADGCPSGCSDLKTDAKTDATKTDAKPDTVKPDTAPPPPTFEAIWNGVVLKYSCNSLKCHGPKGEPYLFPDFANAYGKLLGGTGQASYSCGGKVYVVPGDPKASLLWQKVAPGVAACGDKMPVVIDGDGIDPDDAALVAQWIAAGAPP